MSTLLGQRLKRLRRKLGLSQEAIGAQGVVSAPGWVKIENGQRRASEKLIAKLCAWLVRERHCAQANAGPLQEELLLLKYLDDPSAFVRQAMQAWAGTTKRGKRILEEVRTGGSAQGRPPGVAPEKATNRTARRANPTLGTKE